MVSEYHNLLIFFKGSLQTFKFKLLLYNLLKGGAIMGGSILFFIFLFYCCNSFFQLTILSKKIYYHLVHSLIGLEFLIFMIYPICRFFQFTFFKNNLLLKEILKFPSLRSDILVSVYELAFHSEGMTGDKQLKQAAFIQKYNYLVDNKLFIRFPIKLLLQQLFIFIFIAILFFLGKTYFQRNYNDLCNYEVVHNKHKLSFSILNKNMSIEYGKGLKLKLAVRAEEYIVDRVFICFGGGEFLMTKEDSIFTYDFEIINNDIQFNFKAQEQASDFYKITVLPSPTITGYEVISTPPSYTGMKTEVLTNTVDFRVLYASRLKFKLNVIDIDSLYLFKNNQYTPISLKSENSADLILKIRESGEYAIVGSNQFITKKNLLNFAVTCIPDLYPGIQISDLQDSVKNSLHYFYGVITDDYGFSNLRFCYSLGGKTNSVIPIQISKNTNTQEFYFTFNFAEFAGMDESKVTYYFEIFDNDNISGPKSTRTGEKYYQIPDLNAIFDYNAEVSKTVSSALSDVEKLANEIVSGVKDLQKKMLDDNIGNWEKQQLSKDIMDKKATLDKLLNTVKESNIKKSNLNKDFTKQDSLLISKQKQIQDLLDKVMDDELKKLMDEFSKLSEEFSKDKFNDLDDKMNLTFDQLSEELDRNIELLERFQVEEKHDLISKQLEKLKSDQEKLSELMENSAISSDSLSNLSEKVEENMNDIKKNYSDLLKENADLEKPYSLDTFKSDFDELSNKTEEQKRKSNEGKKDDELSKDVEKKIEELAEKMEEQKKQNFADMSLPQNDIELIIQNILQISFSEELLMQEFSKTAVNSLKYNELGQSQELRRQEYKIVKDSLSVLAKSNLMLASLLSDKFYDIEIKFGLLPVYIQDKKRGELAREQQYIVNYLNDMALSLTDALQKSNQDSKEGKKGEKAGDKKGSKPGEGDQGGSPGEKDGYGQMKKFQRDLKKQLENMLGQMKKGEKGKPFQQGVSNTIRENELFKKSLSDFMSESGTLSEIEKKLINEVNKLLDDNIKDLANYSISNQMVNRNNLIYNKLLMSEKASKEREEYEEKRKSESAQEANYKYPSTKFNAKRKSSLIRTDFQKSDLKLKPYFKTLYNNYYIKLGDE